MIYSGVEQQLARFIPWRSSVRIRPPLPKRRLLEKFGPVRRESLSGSYTNDLVPQAHPNPHLGIGGCRYSVTVGGRRSVG